MNLSPDTLRRAQAILAAHDADFATLARLGGLDAARHFRGANLRNVDFGTDDLGGFYFCDADLSGANLSQARGLNSAMFAGAIYDETTVWPPGFEAVRDGWADDWGRDKYGPWASFSLPAAGGSRVTQRLRWIPPGRFLMGSPKDEEGRWNPEGPQHEATLAAGFWLFDTPCTQALWEAVMGSNPSRFKSPTRPVEQVTFEDVRAFTEKLNALAPGLGLGLPSEAQWEYACRAGTTTATYAGDMRIVGECNAPVLDRIAWYGGNSGVGFELEDGADSSGWPEKQYDHTQAGTRPVGLKVPNAFGLHDMLGNVWEWCADNWHDNYDGAPTDGSAWVDADGGAALRVVRGGSWLDDARLVRAAFRDHYVPSNRNVYLGFRCARVQ